MYSKPFFLAFLLFFTHYLLSAQDTRYIRFRDSDPRDQFRSYRVVTVRDDRTDTTRIGELKVGLLGKKNVTINLEQGVTMAVSRFIEKNFAQDTAATPIEVHITELSVKETPGGIRTKIEAAVTTAFFASGQKLTEYKGKGEVQTMGDVFKHVEDLIRQNLRNSLLEFDTWWGQNKLTYAADAPVQLSVTIDSTTKDLGLIGYTTARLLALDDFKGAPDDMSRAAAATFSNIAVKYSTDIDKGQYKVHVLIAPFFDKEKSWLHAKGRNEKVLVHEQGHFTITAIKACELADTLRQQKLNKLNYQEVLEQIHAQKQKELTARQTQYDAETRHGTLVAVQDKWDKLFKGWLAVQSCYR